MQVTATHPGTPALRAPRPAAAMAGGAGTVGLAALCWALSLRAMKGMDMGVATSLGPFPRFLATWVLMMAAMMLPGAVPAVGRRVRTQGGIRTVPLFLGSYLTVWAVAGVAAYLLYRPHGPTAAGLLAIAAGMYELTPVKREMRRRGRDCGSSGWRFGLRCAGSSLGLMVLLLAVGAMSVTWMSAAAGLILLQKAVPPTAAIDVPVALAIVGLGVLILIDPSAVPGLVPSM